MYNQFGDTNNILEMYEYTTVSFSKINKFLADKLQTFHYENPEQLTTEENKPSSYLYSSFSFYFLQVWSHISCQNCSFKGHPTHPTLFIPSCYSKIDDNLGEKTQPIHNHTSPSPTTTTTTNSSTTTTLLQPTTLQHQIQTQKTQIVKTLTHQALPNDKTQKIKAQPLIKPLHLSAKPKNTTTPEKWNSHI